VSDALVITGAAVRGHALVVDFQAFRTGSIALPPLVVAGRRITGLSVRISSLLDIANDAGLEPALPPLAVPGTLWVVVAAVMIVLAVAALVVAATRARSSRMALAQSARRQYARWVTARALKRISATMTGRAALAAAARETRTFLDAAFGLHCRAFVPRDFGEAVFPPDVAPDTGPRLERLFRRCDTLRFSGESVSDEAVAALLADIASLIASAK
jgi:hypothetical protein